MYNLPTILDGAIELRNIATNQVGCMDIGFNKMHARRPLLLGRHYEFVPKFCIKMSNVFGLVASCLHASIQEKHDGSGTY